MIDQGDRQKTDIREYRYCLVEDEMRMHTCEHNGLWRCGICGHAAGEVLPRSTGSARDVIDYISWMEHCNYVRSKCDSLATAMTVFKSFSRSASAERGRFVDPVPVELAYSLIESSS